MPQPTPFDRSFSFTDFSAATPSGQQPGTSLDAEFDAVELTLEEVLANLVLIQRDDGALANQTVGIDTLAPALVAALHVIGANVGTWATGTAYTAGSFLVSGAVVYMAVSDHTAAALLATDVAAGRMIAVFGGAVGGIGVVDGDKTDIVVSALGTIYTINPTLLTAFGRTVTAAANAGALRTVLGLGALALLGTVNGSNWSGADLAVADGGTGSSTPAAARTALGVAIGSDVQAFSAALALYAAISPSANVQSLLGAADYAAIRAQLSLYTQAQVDSAISAGSAANSYIWPQGDFTANDVGLFATLGNVFIPQETFTVDRLYLSFVNATIGNIYSAFIATINTTTGDITGTIATASSRFTTLATGAQSKSFSLSSPVTLTAGTAYFVGGVITSGTGTSACQLLRAVPVSDAKGYNGGPMPLDIGLMNKLYTTTVKRAWYAQNSDAPSSATASGFGTATQYAVGMRAHL